MREKPRQARARETVEGLLKAAREVVAEGGAAALTTRAISARADVPIGTVYRYFSNRDDIVEALVARDREELDSELSERIRMASLADWGDALDGIIDGVVEFAKARPGFVELARLGRQLPHLDERNLQTLARWTGWMRASPAFESLQIEEHEMRAIITVIVSSVQATIPQALLTDDDALADALVRETKAMIRAYVTQTVTSYLQRMADQNAS